MEQQYSQPTFPQPEQPQQPQYSQPQAQYSQPQQPQPQTVQNEGWQNQNQTSEQLLRYHEQQLQQQLQQQVPVMVQVPEYSDEQKAMQEKIKADRFGLLALRGKLSVRTLIYLIINGMVLFFTMYALLELLLSGGVSGTNIERFLTTEINILTVVYIALILLGGISMVFGVMLYSRVRKITVETISGFESRMRMTVVPGITMASGFLFLSAFWLLTSLSTYWLTFLFQLTLSLVAVYFIYRVLGLAEKVVKIATENELKRDNKPVPAITYYQPIGYHLVEQEAPVMPQPQVQPQPQPQQPVQPQPQQPVQPQPQTNTQFDYTGQQQAQQTPPVDPTVHQGEYTYKPF